MAEFFIEIPDICLTAGEFEHVIGIVAAGYSPATVNDYVVRRNCVHSIEALRMAVDSYLNTLNQTLEITQENSIG